MPPPRHRNAAAASASAAATAPATGPATAASGPAGAAGSATTYPCPSPPSEPPGTATAEVSLDEAIAKNQFCPMCRRLDRSRDPMTYTCPTCAREGYACCVATAVSECPACAAKRQAMQKAQAW